MGTLASLISIFMVGWLEKLFGKKWGYTLCMLSTLILSMVFYLIPENEIWLLMAVHVLISFCFGPTAALVWAMYTDAADYGEWKNGRRATGLVMSACTMAQKLGYTLGGALVVLILFYPLNELQLKGIEADLKVRRAGLE
jgi:GPH family glycoside/pentoside/hexuronide:cation symporter